MVAVKTFLCFFLPTAVLIGSTVGSNADISEERNQYESSVKREEKCPLGERWDSCASCQKTCTSVNENPGACSEDCRPGCVCDADYVRGHHGECIKAKECFNGNFCPKNEEFVACKGLCELDCYWKNITIKECAGWCVSSCRCVSGYVRGPNGTCIKPDECPANDDTQYPVKRVCPEDEIWLGSAHCQTNCTHIHPPVCPRIVVKGCVCKEGYKRRPDGKCIPRNKCPKNDGGNFCPTNEEFVACKGHCEMDCYWKNKQPACAGLCVSSCRCVSGYVRGPKGTCIKPDECPANDDTKYPVKRVCPKDEKWFGFAHCQTNCTHIHPPICPRIIVNGCICKEGYKRRPDGRCIPKDECPKNDVAAPFIFCDSNEEFSLCLSLCPDNCTNYKDKHRMCNRICLPSPGCVCKKNFVEGPDGKCIKYDQCPKKKKPEDCTENEFYNPCGSSCEDNCDNYRDKDRPCDKQCISGCFCKEGMIRGPKGDCIFPFDCSERSPVLEDNQLDRREQEQNIETEDSGIDGAPLSQFLPIFCKKNEVRSVCSCPVDCTNYKTKKCLLCIPGCECKKGYVYGPNGTCIPVKECYKEKKPDDCTDLEYYNTCGTNCENDCKNYNSPDQTCDKSCKIGCFCQPGLVRGPKGDCIWPFHCNISSPKENSIDHLNEPIKTEVFNKVEEANFCPLNEEFVACKSHCEQDCWTRNSTEPPTCYPLCISGCRCVKGYVRDKKGTCIQPDKCKDERPPIYPVKRVCPTDEEWGSMAHCQKNCTYPSGIPCPLILVFGCVCQPEHLRGPDGKCVPKEKCPKKEVQPSEGNELASEALDDDAHGCPNDPAQCSSYCIDSGYKDGACSLNNECLCVQRGHECDTNEDCYSFCYNGQGYCDSRTNLCVC